MKRTLAGLSLASFGVACAFVVSTSHLSAQSLGVATDYNYLVFGNATLQNSDAEGRVAVGGNANYSNYGIGDKLPAGSRGYSLVVGGNLTYGNGQVFEGDVIYGGTLNAGQSFNVRNGSLIQGQYLDFSAARNQLTSFSSSLSQLEATGSFLNEYGTLVFTGTDPNLNTFTIQASDISNSHGIRISAPEGSTVLINVAGASVDWKNMGINLSGTDKQRVLYNFYEATSLNIASISVQGSVLAPNADVTFNYGNLEGTLVANNLSGTGEFHHYAFQGTLIPVPEPSSALLALLAGGIVLLRRKR
ncbi:MAG: choice-of-anchor A family protein [Luteolibacter sp.]